MSIWCSWPTIGHDPHDPDREHREDFAPAGDVRAYIDGWSNHYPLDEFDDLPAGLDLAHTPAWCVPGHRDEHDNDVEVGPWLRLMVDSFEHYWRDPTNVDKTRPESASIVMDEDAVRSLRDQLTEWLDRPKAHPIAGCSSPHVPANGDPS